MKPSGFSVTVTQRDAGSNAAVECTVKSVRPITLQTLCELAESDVLPITAPHISAKIVDENTCVLYAK